MSSMDLLVNDLNSKLRAEEFAMHMVHDMVYTGILAATADTVFNPIQNGQQGVVGKTVAIMACEDVNGHPIAWRKQAYDALGGAQAELFEPAQKASAALVDYLTDRGVRHV